MGLPLRRRTVSGPVTASAGMPSSAVERGLKYSKAAGLCIKGVRVSSADRVFFVQSRPMPGPAQRRNMAQSAQRQGHIAHPGPDVSPFATKDFELGMVRIGLASSRAS